MTYTLPIVATGSSSLRAATSSSTVTPSPSGNSFPGDLVVIVCYTSGDPTGAKDAGDGWVILDVNWNGTWGMFMAACIQSKKGGVNANGITLPSAMDWTCVPTANNIGSGVGKFDLSRACACDSDQGWWTASASGTAFTVPSIIQPAQQVIDVVGLGYNNGGTTTTINTFPTGYSNKNDTGQTSPPHGVGMFVRTAAITGTLGNPAPQVGNGALTAAKTNRSVMRAMIPIVSATRHYFGYGGYRRIG